MKKIFLFVVAVVILLILLYFLSSARQTILTSAVKIDAARNGVIRCLIEKDKWEKWWPSDVNSLRYPEDNFSIQQELLTRVLILVNFSGKYQPSSININPIASDTSVAFWQYSVPSTANPVNFISNHLQSSKIKQQVNNVLQALKRFAEKNENIYGIKIQQVRVKDSMLVSTRIEMDRYPTTELIYKLINELKDYIKGSGASETDYPMMHIEELRNTKFRLMIAIPVNRLLPGTNQIELKRMVLGNILMAEVNGGTETIKRGMKEMENYAFDYGKSSPAIPFQMLVTDRLQQPDTGQWITRIYYPVF